MQSAATPTPVASPPAGTPHVLETLPHGKSRAAILAVFVVCGIIAVSLDAPPRPLSEHASPSTFSAVRAMKHLAVIGRAPHPVKSAEHDRVRDYIVSAFSQLGLHPQVQRAYSEDIDGTLENIVARLPGTSHDKAVLLVAHYDSAPAGPGASDDGVAVAAILETARALKTLPQLRRDIIFLLTDGEEAGLLGAQAFVDKHPWAKDVGVVLNFEARGTTGSSIMFETSDQNGWLISNFGRAASHPVANSLSYEIYKRLPNDTDFTVFRRSGYSGLNFAFIDGLASYHTASDSIKAVDLRSMQHHGDYMLELARQFGNAASDDPKEGNAVYFDVLGLVLVRYGRSASIVLMALAVCLFIAGFVSALRNGKARVGGFLSAVALSVLGIAVFALAAQAASWLVMSFHSPRIHDGLRHHTGWYILAFSALGMAACLELYSLIARWIESDSQIAGGLFWWAVLGVAVTVYVPGGSYLLLWPMLFISAGWLAVNINDRTSGLLGRALLAASGIPAIILIIPMAHKIVWAFSAQSLLIVSVLTGVLFILLVGTLNLKQISRRWILPLSTLVLGLAVLIFAIAISGSPAKSESAAAAQQAPEIG